MVLRNTLFSICSLFCLIVSSQSLNAQDQGKDKIGSVKVALYVGTNDAKMDAGKNAKKVEGSQLKSLSNSSVSKYSHYYLLGSDTPSLLRSYQNWATPLKPSKALMISFEPVGKAQDNTIKLDLNLWQNNKKVMKCVTTAFSPKKPLYIKGPKWREGTLIIAVELTDLK